MAVAQQVMAGDRIDRFAVETQKTAKTAIDPAMTVSRVYLLHRSDRVGDTQHGTLLIGGQQLAVEVVAFARLQRQQLSAVLQYALAGGTLNLGCQMLKTIKPLRRRLPDRLKPGQLIQCVVAITTRAGIERFHYRTPHRQAVSVHQRRHPAT
ncbi:hypothetical protein PMA3_00625 [Pseudomonas silesiensis]|uniref:Uncharacterized protein n=1 Tax=Pseudomonas silesiensis TaxID=1853130 RepID=A0A191YLH4_9PSED|nr:hypothetical protein PMA3_00625 [Pseudomonas silesiensis]